MIGSGMSSASMLWIRVTTSKKRVRQRTIMVRGVFRREKVVNAEGHELRTRCDDLSGQVARSTDVNLFESIVARDPFGRIQRESSSNGETTYRYTSGHRTLLMTCTFPFGINA